MKYGQMIRHASDGAGGQVTEQHQMTDPACRYFDPPRTWVDRLLDWLHVRAGSCPTCTLLTPPTWRETS